MTLESVRVAAFAMLLLAASSASCQRSTAYRRPLQVEPAEEIEPAATPAVAEGALEEVVLQRGQGLSVLLRISGGEYEFASERIEGDDLSGKRFELGSVAGIFGRLTCKDAQCTNSDIVLRRGNKLATIHVETLRLNAVLGQVRDACEVPIFFEEDYEELLSDYPAFGPKIETLRDLREITASRLAVSGWDGEKFENLELQGQDILVRARENGAGAPLEAALESESLSRAVLRIERRVPGDLTALSVLSFDLSEPGVGTMAGAQKRICIDVNVIPAL